MRAFRINKPNEYGMTDVPTPETMDDELLLKVGAAAICHSDIDALCGLRKHMIRYPNILGHEFAGTVVEAGRGVRSFKPGDTVAMECMIGCGECAPCHLRTIHCEHYSELGFLRDGAFAEYVAVPARNAHKFTGMSMEFAATAECAGNGYAAVDAADIKPGERVMIIGPGPIGLYALQFARLKHPSQLIMVGTREERLKFARPFATHTINIREGDALGALMEITAGNGADVVLQCATTNSAFTLAFDGAGKNARIIIEGFGDSEAGVSLRMDQFIKKTLTVKGLGGMNSEQFEYVLRLMRMGVIDPSKLITHTFALENIIDGFNLLRDHTGDAVKVIIKP
ncbi:MAG: alcohol dehydrogenase catalytic domain-containing protein [Oscillospiraceae bacterium]|nr:alcohol dehydrogenase catalytic domain-containing protein [Oscillospiraceae bacterium]